MGNHSAPAILLSQKVSINGLCHTANLVDLQEEAVASLLLNSCSNALRIGHSQVITNNLDVGGRGHLGPVLPVILWKKDVLLMFVQFVINQWSARKT